MLDQGNAQLSPVGTFNPGLGQVPCGDFFGGGIGGIGPSSFSLGDGMVQNCCLYFGRKWVGCADYPVNLDDGNWKGFILARVDHSSQNAPELTVEQRSGGDLSSGPSGADSTPFVTYRALYFLDRGAVVDLRMMPQVPAYLP